MFPGSDVFSMQWLVCNGACKQVNQDLPIPTRTSKATFITTMISQTSTAITEVNKLFRIETRSASTFPSMPVDCSLGTVM